MRSKKLELCNPGSAGASLSASMVSNENLDDIAAEANVC